MEVTLPIYKDNYIISTEQLIEWKKSLEEGENTGEKRHVIEQINDILIACESK